MTPEKKERNHVLMGALLLILNFLLGSLAFACFIVLIKYLFF